LRISDIFSNADIDHKEKENLQTSHLNNINQSQIIEFGQRERILERFFEGAESFWASNFVYYRKTIVFIEKNFINQIKLETKI